MTVKLRTNVKYDIGAWCELKGGPGITLRFKVINKDGDGRYLLSLEEIVEIA